MKYLVNKLILCTYLRTFQNRKINELIIKFGYNLQVFNKTVMYHVFETLIYGMHLNKQFYIKHSDRASSNVRTYE